MSKLMVLVGIAVILGYLLCAGYVASMVYWVGSHLELLFPYL